MEKNIYNKAIRVVRGVVPFCLLSLLPVFSSCSDEDYLGGHYTTDGAGTQMNVTGQVNQSVAGGMTIPVGASIGISTTYANYDMTSRNREYVLQENGTVFQPANGLSIYVKGNTDIMAYYPFVPDENAEPTLTLSTLEQDNPVDFLLAKAENISIANASNVNLDFKPALATLNVNITADGETISEYILSGFAQQGGIDPYTFVVTPSATRDIHGSGTNITSLSFHIVPQTVEEGSAQLTLKGSVRTYTLSLGAISLGFCETTQLNVNIANGIATYEFVPNGAQWSDSGLGDNSAISK